MSLPLLGAGMATDGFDPLSISGLQFWVDAADSATLYTDSALTTLAVSDGDVVGGWKDKSPSACNLTQTDGTKKPLLKLSVQNSKNAVRWDSVNDNLDNTTIAICPNSFTVFVAKKRIAYVVNAGLNFRASVHSNGYLIVDDGSPVNSDYDGFRGIYEPNAAYVNSDTGSASIRTVSVVSTQVNKSRINLLDRTASGGNTHGGFSNDTFFRALDSEIYEVLLYNSALSNSDILLVEGYLKTKWGTP